MERITMSSFFSLPSNFEEKTWKRFFVGKKPHYTQDVYWVYPDDEVEQQVHVGQEIDRLVCVGQRPAKFHTLNRTNMKIRRRRETWINGVKFHLSRHLQCHRGQIDSQRHAAANYCDCHLSKKKRWKTGIIYHLHQRSESNFEKIKKLKM